MENPNSWNLIQKLIHKTIIEHQKDLEDMLYGFSLETKIYHALLEHGFIKEPLATSDKND